MFSQRFEVRGLCYTDETYVEYMHNHTATKKKSYLTNIFVLFEKQMGLSVITQNLNFTVYMPN